MQIKSKIQKLFYSKKSWNPSNFFIIFSTLQGFILETSLIALRSLKRLNSFFMCQIMFFHILAYFLFCFSSERLLYLSLTFFRFLSFSSSERFWYLSRSSLRSIFFLDNIYLLFFIYVGKKIFFTRIFFIRISFHLNFFQNFFIRIFFTIRIFFHLDFFRQSFFIRIRRNLYIINNLLMSFFSLMTYLHSSKNTWGWSFLLVLKIESSKITDQKLYL